MAIYLHFGEIPDGGKSVCYTLTDGTWHRGAWADMDEEERAEFAAAGYAEVDGVVYEPGLSVFGLAWDADDSDAELKFDRAQVDAEMVAEMAAERPAYLIEGETIGEGFDGEPVIGGCRVLGRASAVRVEGHAIFAMR